MVHGEQRPWTSTPIPISVIQRTSAIVPPPTLSVALVAAASFVEAPSQNLRSFNGSRPGKSSGMAANGVAEVVSATRRNAKLLHTLL